MFQYKARFKADYDIAGLYKARVYYDCSPLGVEELANQKLPILGSEVDRNLILQLPSRDQLPLTIYDVTLRLGKTLFDGQLPAGKHTFSVS